MNSETDQGQCNLHWAHTLIAQLFTLGIDHYVLSPGSRSSPLTLAVARTPGVNHTVIVDERSAAFFALGMGRQRRRASALICTSGSAVANWLPAVVEANHGAIPLLLISADRPPELHHRGANQTIEQRKLFSGQLREQQLFSTPDPTATTAYQQISSRLPRLVAALNEPLPGPVHLNIPFREPLLPTEKSAPFVSMAEPSPRPPPTPDQPVESINFSALATLQGRPGIILCGEGHYPLRFQHILAELAERLDVPVFLDPLSNLRWGEHPHPRFLTHLEAGSNPLISAGHHPEWVIQLGDFPMTGGIVEWLRRAAVNPFITVTDHRHWSDPHTLSTTTFHCSSLLFCKHLLQATPNRIELPGWMPPFHQIELRASSWIPPQGGRPTEFQLLRHLHHQLAAGTVLFSSNSMAIRDIDRWMPLRTAPLTLHANRGTSGIDGNLSTLCGIRAATSKETPVVGILGDLALFHDLNALELVRRIGGNLTLIIIQNGGGGIFSYLPPAQLPEFESLWLTPTGLSSRRAAALFDIESITIDSHEALQRWSLSPQHPHPLLIEYVVDRPHSVALHHHYRDHMQ